MSTNSRPGKKEFHAWLDEKDDQDFRRIADLSGLTRTDILHRWIASIRLPNRNTARLICELRRQGGLLKHAAFDVSPVRHQAGLQREFLKIAKWYMKIARNLEQSYYPSDN